MDLVLRRRRSALLLAFFIPGISMSSWITRTPAIRDILGASTSEMGLVLFGLSVGSMSGILSAGLLVRRFGTRPVAAVGLTLMIVGMATIALGAVTSVAVVVAAGLAFFGGGMGSAEIAINIEGSVVERIQGRPLLTTLHGCFSLGTVAGAVAGIALTAADFPVALHLSLIALITIPAAVWAVRAIPAGTGIGARTPEAPSTPRASAAIWRDSRLVLIGLIVLAMALAEGAANDWLPLLMVDGHGFDATAGSLIFAGFAASMTIGRFSGGFFLSRFGRVAVVRASAVFGVIGLALVIFAEHPGLAGAAVVFWGLGTSLGFPISISAAGDSPHDAARRVSAVATTGYVAFLVGPPLLGFLGDEYGLRGAMVVVLTFVLAAVFLAPAVRPTRSPSAGQRTDTPSGEDDVRTTSD
ncbi:fucose permease [Actinoalloteichus hoggarensis]|uniref:Inner membrane protein YbjJ n=2 Tax=Actinoalloteichus hoggarensis TaxID=1470176 RepID=A0A221W8J6_9PSEU|nr:MFS transporter [Actinoalloteichus hoggarensis]ASO21667.1 Inner membrane protein YbjJ [Actinoalloteichus hoggarensis]MBB5922260.1 fucose permease [Actinoalloteichus hoggarensis]